MIERIRAFLVILQTGSVNKAAKRLGIAQPTLSRQIQSLEQEMGGALFERGAWGMRATDLGFKACELFRPVLLAHDQAWADLTAFASGRHKQLRIGYLGMAVARFLNPALATLKGEFPDLKLILFDQTPAEQIQALREGTLDVAMIGEELGAAEEDFYKRCAKKLGTCAILPVDHPLANNEQIPLSSLAGEAFIGVSEEAVPGRNAWMRRLCAKAGFKPRFTSHTSEVSETFTRVASEGAVSLLPDYVDGHPPPGTAYVRLSDKWANWRFFILRQRGRGSAAARRLVGLIGSA